MRYVVETIFKQTSGHFVFEGNNVTTVLPKFHLGFDPTSDGHPWWRADPARSFLGFLVIVGPLKNGLRHGAQFHVHFLGWNNLWAH